MYGERFFLPPDGDVEDPLADDLHDGGFVRSPCNSVTEQLEVIGGKDFPEGAVDVPWKIDDAAAALAGKIAEEELSDVGSGGARVNLFHRQIGIAGDESEWRGELAPGLHFDSRGPVNDPWGVFEALEERMFGPVLEPQIGV